jgi:hypothetical protein
VNKRSLRIILAMGLILSAFAGVMGTASADQEPSDGIFFPWIPNGEMLDGTGPWHGTVTIQNLESAAINLYAYVGVGGSTQAYDDPVVVANVQANASVTLTAVSLDIPSPGASVHVFGLTPIGNPALIAGSSKNVSPVPSSDAKTSSAHIVVDGYTGMTDDQVNTNDFHQVLPIVQTNTGWNTKIRIANFGSEANPNPSSSFTVTLYEAGGQGAAGGSSGEFTQLLRRGGVWTLDIGAAPGIPEGWVGSAYITSNQPFGAIAERVKPSTDMLITNVSRPVEQASSQQFAPLIFKNYNFWNTGISVANTDPNNSNTVTINYITSGGSVIGVDQLTIPPRGMEFVYTPGNQDLNLGGIQGFVGAAVLTGTTTLHAAVDEVKYFGNLPDVGHAMSYVTQPQPAVEGEALALPLVQKGNPNTGLGDTSGVQLFNTSASQQVNFHIMFYDPTGNPVAPTLNVPFSGQLSPHAGFTLYTHNLTEMPSGFQGSLVIDVSGPGGLAAVSNNVNYDVNGDGSVAYNLIRTTTGGVPRTATSFIIDPEEATNVLGDEHDVTVTVFDQFGDELPGANVSFWVNAGPNEGGDSDMPLFTGTTDDDGETVFTWGATEIGVDEFEVEVEGVAETQTGTKEWIEGELQIELLVAAFGDEIDFDDDDNDNGNGNNDIVSLLSSHVDLTIITPPNPGGDGDERYVHTFARVTNEAGFVFTDKDIQFYVDIDASDVYNPGEGWCPDHTVKCGFGTESNPITVSPDEDDGIARALYRRRGDSNPVPISGTVVMKAMIVDSDPANEDTKSVEWVVPVVP